MSKAPTYRGNPLPNALDGDETPEQAAEKLVGDGQSPALHVTRAIVAKAIREDRRARAATSSAILPPTGQPFEVVGTVEAHKAVRVLVDFAYGGAPLGAAGQPSRILESVIAHRSHLDKQVTDLQVTNTMLVMLARNAESKLAGVQACLDGLSVDECPMIDPRDKGAADAWKSAFRWTQGLLARSVDPITITLARMAHTWHARLDGDRWCENITKCEAIGDLVQEYADELSLRVVVKEGDGQ